MKGKNTNPRTFGRINLNKHSYISVGLALNSFQFHWTDINVKSCCVCDIYFKSIGFVLHLCIALLVSHYILQGFSKLRHYSKTPSYKSYMLEPLQLSISLNGGSRDIFMVGRGTCGNNSLVTNVYILPVRKIECTQS